MTELVQYQEPTGLEVQMDYARAVSTASMLPDNYRNKPADIMLAVGLGQAMGLSPAESLYRISVIKGKPTASAELIAANVRKAGHRLRVATDEQGQSVTATIFRADDPEFPFEVTRDMAWAKSMGLATNDNYRKQALTMLQWRAITACARLACPEALYGVAHTPDEMGDFDDAPRPTAAGTTGADRMRQVLTVEQVHPEPSGAEPGMSTDVASETASHSAPEPLLLNTGSKLAKAMYAALREAEQAGAFTDAKAFMSEVTGREVTSSKELTEDEARMILDNLPQTSADA